MKDTIALLTLALIGASATVANAECRDCATPDRRYDTEEVIRTVREVDHSRVINTRSEVITRTRIVMPVVKTVEIVVQHYRVIEVPNTSDVSMVSYPANRYHRSRLGRWLRVRG